MPRQRADAAVLLTCSRPTILSALLLFASLTSTAQAQSPNQNAALLERLDRLEQQNRELFAEIRELREQIQKSAAPSTQQPTSPTSSTVEERREVNEHRVEELAQTKVEASQKFPIQLTGMALFNAFLNGRYSGSAQYPVVANLTEGQL